MASFTIFCHAQKKDITNPKQTHLLQKITIQGGTTLAKTRNLCDSVSGVNGAVRDDKSFCDWIYTRQEIATLVSDGLVEEREYRGIKILYPKDTP